MLTVCYCTSETWHGMKHTLSLLSFLPHLYIVPYQTQCHSHVRIYTNTLPDTQRITSTTSLDENRLFLLRHTIMEDGNGLLVRVDIPDIKAQVRL